MQLSQKQNTFSQLPPAFLKSNINYEYLEKKYEKHRFCVSKITDSENVVK